MFLERQSSAAIICTLPYCSRPGGGQRRRERRRWGVEEAGREEEEENAQDEEAGLVNKANPKRIWHCVLGNKESALQSYSSACRMLLQYIFTSHLCEICLYTSILSTSLQLPNAHYTLSY